MENLTSNCDGSCVVAFSSVLRKYRTLRENLMYKIGCIVLICLWTNKERIGLWGRI
jgi:hypothetical protein